MNKNFAYEKHHLSHVIVDFILMIVVIICLQTAANQNGSPNKMEQTIKKQ